MKFSKKTFVPVALLAAGGSAQGDAVTLSVVTGPGEGTTTQYYSYCSTAPTGLITITGTDTVTYCPGPNCNGSPAPTEAPRPGGEFTTVYTTVYSQFCSSGLEAVTYTISEACPCESIGSKGYYPAGFTTTVSTCSVCGPESLTATLTIPIPGYTGGAASGGGSPAGAAKVVPTLAGSPAQGTSGQSGSGTGTGSGSGSGAGSGTGSGSGSASPGSGSGSGTGSGSGSPGSGTGSGTGTGSGSGGSGAGGAAPASRVGGGAVAAPTTGAGSSGSGSNGSGSSGNSSAPSGSLPQEFRGAAVALSAEAVFLTSVAALVGAVAWML